MPPAAKDSTPNIAAASHAWEVAKEQGEGPRLLPGWQSPGHYVRVRGVER